MKKIGKCFGLHFSRWFSPKLFVSLMLFFIGLNLMAQGKRIEGTIVDSKNEPLIGVNVTVKDKPGVGVITSVDGKFSITVDNANAELVISFLGMETQTINVKDNTQLKIVMVEDNKIFSEVVIVGYGQQKKASIVGAISQASGEVLLRASGVNDVSSALTGNLPGVVTVSGSGMPGEEGAKIQIRAPSSWNNSEPLVLVDGIERSMNSVDVNSIESVSVLKDASATAVFGVKGANGVILITTKRGKLGAARIDISANSTMKVPSKLPNKYDSYDALMARNTAIEHELGVYPDSWGFMTPQSIIEKYRNPSSLEESERYPNVDWQDELFKDYTMSYSANLNVSGGTDVVKYFASADFANEGDIFRVWDNGRNYESGFGYNRLNVRSNLDFQLTKSTVFKVSISGSNGVKKSPWGMNNSSDWAVAQFWAGAYNIAPDVFLPKYSDGSWGYYPNISNVTNSAMNLATSGVMNTTTTTVNTDFILEQDLSFVTKGLSFRGTVAWDNIFVENNRGINDLYNSPQEKWINPESGIPSYAQDFDDNNFFEYTQGVLWSVNGGEIQNWATQRNLSYQAQLNWARKFNQHNFTAMGTFARSERATGNEVPFYREDWIFRGTYDYAGKYFADYSGAYNGSDRFSQEYRFAFFNSGAIGWMISEEKFMESIGFLDMLKIRASYGEIGDDNVTINNQPLRWLYMTQWAYGGNSSLDVNQGTSPYTWYRESQVGNPDVKWETVKKLNIGLDFAVLDGLFAGSVDVFKDSRTDVLLAGGVRSVPSYFGATPPTANLGEVETQGYEAELRFNKVLPNKMRLWSNLSMTHAQSEILEREDPELYPDYQKQAGYSINQQRAFVDAGFIGSYDQMYASTPHDNNDVYKLQGDYDIIDFNGDGVIDANDRVPYGYSNIPQNTYNATLGLEWKGFSGFVQFYGVNNVTREVTLASFGSNLNTVYDMGNWWSPTESSPEVTVPRWMSRPSYNDGTQYMFDGSFVRLKNAELAYTFTQDKMKKYGISSLKIFVSGNNLWVWSKMPDDRESNFTGAGGQGAYPSMKRYNLGIRLSL
jgi:TonB-linked SusC/RagA family outer membrane protein